MASVAERGAGAHNQYGGRSHLSALLHHGSGLLVHALLLVGVVVLGGLLLLLGLGRSESGVVLSHDADEVGIEEVDDGGHEDAPHNVLLLGLSDVTSVSGSGIDVLALVPVDVVNHVPGGDQSGSVDDELAGHEQARARVFVVTGEPSDEEGHGDEHQGPEGQRHAHVPPVLIVLKESVHELREEQGGEEDSDNSDDDDSTLDREDPAAGQVSGLALRALADTAAAHVMLVVIDGLVRLSAPVLGFFLAH